MTNFRGDLTAVPSKTRSLLAERAKKINVMDDESEDMLWRWEVKSLASFGSLKPAAQSQRVWRKQVRPGNSEVFPEIKLIYFWIL